MSAKTSKNILFSLSIYVFLINAALLNTSFAGISYEQSQRAAKYAKDQYRNSPNYYLAAKGIRNLLSKLAIAPPKGAKVLDFGCGPGTLSSFYYDLGYQVTGVDISEAMIEKGKKQFPLIDFQLIPNGPLPFKDGEFDAVFTSFVFLEVSDSGKIIQILKDLKRVIKKNAPLVVVTTSENVYRYKKYNFVASKTNFPENDMLVSGAKVKLQLKSLDFAFEDYFWSDVDYRSFFQKAGFNKTTLDDTLGSEEDEINLQIKWLSEKEVSPISVYLVQ